MNADQVRNAFTGFFAGRDHVVLPSASLIPHDPSLLFTVAGMVPFKPYFVGDEVPPHRRVTTVQKVVRAGGKHNDLDEIGHTTRHLTFFEMLGNFSFGDYFKAEAIPMAWEFVTEVLGLDPDRLWVTVHVTDDEAAEIWTGDVGVAAERVQRLDEDNFWKMGDTGPCGPCSEIFWDKGEAYGAGGGPAVGGDERFIEIWNLVFMQYDQQPDGTKVPLPKPSIDTGAGLERVLSVLQGVDSVFELDTIRPLIERASFGTGRRYGDDPAHDVSLRIIADHARSVTFLIGDGVVPSNEDRGYVVRMLIRRAVRHAYLLGQEDGLIMPAMAAEVASVMEAAYPELTRSLEVITDTVRREEERFRQTLRTGMAILDDALVGVTDTLPGEVAFKLHDTYGFPLELTIEIAGERGVAVDRAGFDAEMADQRARARQARKEGSAGDDRAEEYRALLEAGGTSTFVGYDHDEADATVRAVLPASGADGDETDSGELVEIFLDRTPFYAEAGGQIGDQGTISTDTGEAEVIDTTYALPGLHRHLARVRRGTIEAGQRAHAAVDAARRNAIRRHHTGTHLLHWALREVLGPHVKQAGSIVQPDRLRFDFSHHSAVTADELAAIEALANREVLANDPVVTEETSKAEADARGVIAFFGDKYGDTVRVLNAGRHSLELCGGTHVRATGDIGPIKIVSEGSIGANTRRIEAVTGEQALAVIAATEQRLGHVADLLGTTPDDAVDALERRLAELRTARDELRDLKRHAAAGEAAELAAHADDGIVVARRDGLDQKELRDLAARVRDQSGVKAVVLGGQPDPAEPKVALVAAVVPDAGMVASDLLAEAARLVGGGGGKGADMASAGGRDASKLDEALAAARRAAA